MKKIDLRKFFEKNSVRENFAEIHPTKTILVTPKKAIIEFKNKYYLFKMKSGTLNEDYEGFEKGYFGFVSSYGLQRFNMFLLNKKEVFYEKLKN
jgi:hypothetical protein